MIRYAILNEVWRLVASGVLNVQDIDSVMSDGLGMRYAFLGPLETAHLNAEGWLNYCDRYNKSIYDVSHRFEAQIESNPFFFLSVYFIQFIFFVLLQVSQTFGEIPRMSGPMAAEIAKQLEEMCPLDKLPERRSWRDNCLTQLSVLKKKL